MIPLVFRHFILTTLEGNIAINVYDLGQAKPSQDTKSTSDKKKNSILNLNQIKIFWALMDIIKEMKRQPTESEKEICKTCLLRDVYKEHIKNSYNKITKKVMPNF